MRPLTWLLLPILCLGTIWVSAQEGSFSDEAEASALPVEEMAPAPAPPSQRGSWDLPVELDDKVKIGKIHEFLNDPESTKTGGNRALEFEFEYFNHGAVTKDQLRGRMGNYYIVRWSNHGPASDLTLRLDYRQAQSKDLVRTLEIPFGEVKGGKKGTFKVIGKAYHDFGKVHSWRISLVRDGKIVAQEKSFVW